MSYIRAEDVLPSDVLAMVQNYVDGEMLYVPRKSTGHNAWRSVSGTRKKHTANHQEEQDNETNH